MPNSEFESFKNVPLYKLDTIGLINIGMLKY